MQTTARQIRCVLEWRYWRILPDDDAGRDDAALMLQYLAHVPHAELKMPEFLDTWCPWMKQAERDAFMRTARRSRRPPYKADDLADRLGVDFATRQFLGLTQIGATDVRKAARVARRKRRRRERDRRRGERRRRAAGSVAREQYLAVAVTREIERSGKARRTWYRRVAQVRPPTPLGERVGDAPVPLLVADTEEGTSEQEQSKRERALQRKRVVYVEAEEGRP
jgi:hypothetical protein